MGDAGDFDVLRLGRGHAFWEAVEGRPDAASPSAASGFRLAGPTADVLRRAASGSGILVVLEEGARPAPGLAAELAAAASSLPPEAWDLLHLGWDLESSLALRCPGMLDGDLCFRISAAGLCAEGPPAAGARPSAPAADARWPSAADARWPSAAGHAAAPLLGRRAVLGVAEAPRRLCACAVSPAGARRLLGGDAMAAEPSTGRPRAFAVFPPLVLPRPSAGDPAAEEAAGAAAAEAPPGGVEDGVAGGGAGGAEAAAPAPEADAEPPTTWRVTGGGDAGIIVRSGAALDSPVLGRLMRGAVVRELGREGHRVSYELMLGEGPDFGWVSWRTAAGVDLMEQLGAGPMRPTESAEEQRWRLELAQRRQEDALRRERLQRDLEERARTLEQAKDDVAFQEWLAAQERQLASGVAPRPHGAAAPVPGGRASGGSTTATPESAAGDASDSEPSPPGAPAAGRDGRGGRMDDDVVGLWANGDLEQAWWLEEGADQSPTDDDEAAASAAPAQAAPPAEAEAMGPSLSALAFFMPDNDPDEVVDLAEARGRAMGAERGEADGGSEADSGASEDGGDGGEVIARSAPPAHAAEDGDASGADAAVAEAVAAAAAESAADEAAALPAPSLAARLWAEPAPARRGRSGFSAMLGAKASERVDVEDCEVAG